MANRNERRPRYPVSSKRNNENLKERIHDPPSDKHKPQHRNAAQVNQRRDEVRRPKPRVKQIDRPGVKQMRVKGVDAKGKSAGSYIAHTNRLNIKQRDVGNSSNPDKGVMISPASVDMKHVVSKQEGNKIVVKRGVCDVNCHVDQIVKSEGGESIRAPSSGNPSVTHQPEKLIAVDIAFTTPKVELEARLPDYVIESVNRPEDIINYVGDSEIFVAFTESSVNEGWTLVKKCRTSPCYKLCELRLRRGTVNALQRHGNWNTTGGRYKSVPVANSSGVPIHVYSLTLKAFATFVSEIDPPLSFGSVSLANGDNVIGIIVEKISTQGYAK